MAELRILPPAAKYFKKLKDKQLKRLFQEAIDEILEDPSVGEEKTGDLKGINGYDIFYNHTNYELAYTIEYVKIEYVKRNNSDAVDVVVVIMAGTRENFYEALKRYWS